MVALFYDGTEVHKDINDINKRLESGWVPIQTAKAIVLTEDMNKQVNRNILVCFRLAKDLEKVSKLSWCELIIGTSLTKKFEEVEDTPTDIRSIQIETDYTKVEHLIENDYILMNKAPKNFTSSNKTTLFYLGLKK